MSGRLQEKPEEDVLTLKAEDLKAENGAESSVGRFGKKYKIERSILYYWRSV